MHPLLSRSFGGLTRHYYLRNFMFGLLFPAMYMIGAGHAQTLSFGVAALLIVNTLLYPYARFVYESVVGFILGDNLFFLNAIFVLIVKVFTMALCWAFALFIAPLGLLYLYYRNSRPAA